MSETPQTEPQPHKQPKRSPVFNWERAIAALALALSVTAILVSLAEVSTVRSHSKATIWPHLSVDMIYGQDGTSIKLANKGVGPALVKDIVMELDGEIITNLDTAIADSLGPEMAFSYETYRRNDVSNSVIASGEKIDLFAVPNAEAPNKLMEMWDSKLDVRLCYCSIQEDCWTTSLIAKDTTSIEQCARMATPNALRIKESDFAPLLGETWTGSLNYKDYTSGQQTVIPIEADVEKVTARTIVYRIRFPKEPDYNSTKRIRISSDGTRIDGAPIVKRERVDGRLHITTRERSTDNYTPSNIENIYEIGKSRFDIVQFIIPDDGSEPFERNRYTFER